MTNVKMRGRPRKATREDLSFRAMEIYCHQGLSRISFNEICRQLDIAKPSVYRNFGNEDGLIASALKLYVSEITQKLNEIIKTDENFMIQLERLQDFFLDISLRYNQGCLLLQAWRIQGDLGKQIIEFLKSTTQKLVKIFELWIKSALIKKEVSKAVKPNIGAYLVLSCIGFCQTAISSGMSTEHTREVMSLSLSSLTHSFA